MLRKLLGALLVVVIVLVGVAYMLPREVHVERSIVIERPAATIYTLLSSFKRFNEWSPWSDLDLNAKTTLSGPESGVGARLSWSGNDKIGTGTEVITAMVPNESVSCDLDFGSQGIAKAGFQLLPDANGTRVVWSVDMDMGNNPVGRYMGLAMDGMIGKDYDKGLARMKALLEKEPVSS